MAATTRFSRLQVLLLVLILLAIFMGLVLFMRASFLRASVGSKFDPNSYQAVSLDTGETFFGKVVNMDESFVSLANIYRFYDQDKSKLVKSSSRNPKLINREHIISIEKLKEPNSILRAIQSYEK